MQYPHSSPRHHGDHAKAESVAKVKVCVHPPGVEDEDEDADEEQNDTHTVKTTSRQKQKQGTRKRNKTRQQKMSTPTKEGHRVRTDSK